MNSERNEQKKERASYPGLEIIPKRATVLEVGQ
jgi:hypothetical protein